MWFFEIIYIGETDFFRTEFYHPMSMAPERERELLEEMKVKAIFN